MDRGLVAADGGIVQNVVVDQGSQMKHLDGGGAGDDGVVQAPSGSCSGTGKEDHHGSADHLAMIIQQSTVILLIGSHMSTLLVQTVDNPLKILAQQELLSFCHGGTLPLSR